MNPQMMAQMAQMLQGHGGSGNMPQQQGGGQITQMSNDPISAVQPPMYQQPVQAGGLGAGLQQMSKSLGNYTNPNNQNGYFGYGDNQQYYNGPNGLNPYQSNGQTNPYDSSGQGNWGGGLFNMFSGQ